MSGIYGPRTIWSALEEAESKKRKVFFSFHYADIMRVNNVRMCNEFKKRPGEGTLMTDGERSIEGFYDKSLWESKMRTGEESLKAMIRDGVHNSSVICVLAGSHTWERRWVRYEIARGIIDAKGFLVVHLNNVTHHSEKIVHTLGPNPLDAMGIYLDDNNKYRLCEWKNGKWEIYKDYIQPISIPKYMKSPEKGKVHQLSTGVSVYDFALGTGHSNIGAWIDAAALQVGR